MPWKVSVLPAVEPWTLAEVKSFLKVDTSDEDDLITSLITASRQAAESYLNMALISQTIQERLDVLNKPILYLSVNPVLSFSNFKYQDSSNTQVTWDNSNYKVDTCSRPCRLALQFGKSWPTLYGNINDVLLTYVAGFSAQPSGVPMQIRQAILMMVANAYDNREDYVKKMPTASQYLLDQYRVQYF